MKTGLICALMALALVACTRQIPFDDAEAASDAACAGGDYAACADLAHAMADKRVGG